MRTTVWGMGKRVSPDRDPLSTMIPLLTDPQKEHGTRQTPRKIMGPETGSDIIPPVNRQTGVKTVPCSKLRLRAVIKLP